MCIIRTLSLWRYAHTRLCISFQSSACQPSIRIYLHLRAMSLVIINYSLAWKVYNYNYIIIANIHKIISHFSNHECLIILWNVFLLASQPVYIDCKDAYSKGQRASQVYTINSDRGVPFQAYCNMGIDGGGWTVLVRQRNGSFGFNRSWKDNVNGFGDLNGEHWLGLEKVHWLTKTISLLRVDVTSYTQSFKYVKYNEFKMGPAQNYAQYFSNYSGNIDSLRFHDGVKFDIKSDHGRVVCGEYNLKGVQYKQCMRIDGKRIFSALGFFEGKTHRRNDPDTKTTFKSFWLCRSSLYLKPFFSSTIRLGTPSHLTLKKSHLFLFLPVPF